MSTDTIKRSRDIEQFLDHFQGAASKASTRISQLEANVGSPQYFSVSFDGTPVVNTVVEGTLHTLLLGASFIEEKSVLPFTYWLSVNSAEAAATMTFSLYFSSQLAASFVAIPVPAGTERLIIIDGFLYGRYSNSKQAGISTLTIGQPKGTFSAVEPTLVVWNSTLLNIDATIPQQLTLKTTFSVANPTVSATLKMATIKYPTQRT
jgi:hypothetical protein